MVCAYTYIPQIILVFSKFLGRLKSVDVRVEYSSDRPHRFRLHRQIVWNFSETVEPTKYVRTVSEKGEFSMFRGSFTAWAISWAETHGRQIQEKAQTTKTERILRKFWTARRKNLETMGEITL